MKNPFITLTRIKNEGSIRININHIISYQLEKFSNSPSTYTYILLGGNCLTREVTETVQEIDAMVDDYFSQGNVL